VIFTPSPDPRCPITCTADPLKYLTYMLIDISDASDANSFQPSGPVTLLLIFSPAMYRLTVSGYFTCSSILAGPREQGEGVECALYDTAGACLTYDLETGATTMTNIAGCDAAATEAISANVTNITMLTGESTVHGTVSAQKLADTAIIGGDVHPFLKVKSIEACLIACSEWIPSCTQVVIGAVIEFGRMPPGRPFLA
jgi:hypothetical protein